MLLSGWLMVTSMPIRIPISLFGIVDLPFPLPPDLATDQAARTTHLVLTVALALTVIVHRVDATELKSTGRSSRTGPPFGSV
jgi:cytochrome b561